MSPPPKHRPSRQLKRRPWPWLKASSAQLPPVEIPSGGLARAADVSYELGLSLDVPSEAEVYQLLWPERTADDVATIATSLGIDGDVADQGDGVFSVDGDGGSLYVAPDVVQISLDPAAANGGLADDATSIDAARTWLLENSLVGDDIGDGSVISKDANAARATVYFSTDAASPLLAAYPSARVTVGPGGAIYEAYVKWPAELRHRQLRTFSADDLWAAVQAGQGYLEADLSSIPGEGPVSGTLTVTNVSIAYSTAGGDGGEYLAPIIVFSGEAVLDVVGRQRASFGLFAGGRRPVGATRMSKLTTRRWALAGLALLIAVSAVSTAVFTRNEHHARAGRRAALGLLRHLG